MTIRKALLAAMAMFAAPFSPAYGEIFSTELTFAPTAGTYGQYLTATYDFGVTFDHVQSVWLELDMPAGYEGTFTTTGNSSYSRYLSMQLHDPTDPPPVDYLLEYLGTVAIDVPPGSPAEFSFGRFQINFPEGIGYADWPSFLLGGSGKVALIDVNSSYYHPLPDGEGSTSTTTWLLPTGVAGARLFVDTTPIPEPSAAVLVVVATLASWRWRRLC